jgi:hypothetical protein
VPAKEAKEDGSKDGTQEGNTGVPSTSVLYPSCGSFFTACLKKPEQITR